ncbi:MAG TPA: VCBS repeat-containing protein [Candidatus Sulfotelmatobacter sp.]|nr:VCBS repeat-containing protein [Candidatus Sulfotelmatobacter sp.]
MTFRYLLGVFALAFSLPLVAQVTFSATTYPAPSSATQNLSVAADIDSDGNPDLITTDGSNPQVLLWYGIGGGKFGSPEIVGNLDGSTQDVAVGDFNGDGRLDILVTTTGPTNAVDLLINDGSRTFSKKTISTPDPAGYVAVGDFNNDGKLDFALSSTDGTGAGYIRIYIGNGDGTFNIGSQLMLPKTNYYYQTTYRLMAADLNKDGKTDLVNVFEPTTVFLNTGNATFSTAQSITAPNGGTYVYGYVGDLNGDAAPDLFLTGNQFCGEGCGWIKSLDSYLNDGTGHFTLKQSVQPTGSSDSFGVLADLNYDGKLDMVFNSDGVLEYALGNGDGTFQAVQQSVPLNGQYSDSPTQLLPHDLNNDGLMDIASTASFSILTELNTSAKPDCGSPNSSSLTSNVCSPAAGETVSSSFPVRAVANGPVDIARIEEWLDGKKVYQKLLNQVRNTLTASVGQHTLTIVAVDVLNNIAKKNFSLNVINCPAPSTAGVHICTPASGSTLSSPVSVNAAATSASGTYITAMRLYVDNVAKYAISGSKLSASVALTTGSHYLAVVAYEANGQALKSTEYITVH